MPTDAIGGEALCFVGAPDHERALRLAVEELNARGYVVEDLIGRSVGQVIPSRWEMHAQEICHDLTSRFCGSAAAVQASLPDAAGIEKLIDEGGFHLGPFYCWDTEPDEREEGAELSDAASAQHDELYNTGYDLIKDLVYFDNRPYQPPDAAAREQLREAIRRFEQALDIVPGNWQAMLLMGKALQSLGEHEQALTAFLRAHQCAPTQLMVAVEAGSAAGRVGQHDVAIRVMASAARHHPEDPRLPFNLGLSYLFLGDYTGARSALERAIELEPQREENKRLRDLVIEVEAGRRPCPRNEAEVANALS
jgi:tetratricopeptide (TPR) repeat protein